MSHYDCVDSLYCTFLLLSFNLYCILGGIAIAVDHSSLPTVSSTTRLPAGAGRATVMNHPTILVQLAWFNQANDRRVHRLWLLLSPRKQQSSSELLSVQMKDDVIKNTTEVEIEKKNLRLVTLSFYNVRFAAYAFGLPVSACARISCMPALHAR